MSETAVIYVFRVDAGAAVQLKVQCEVHSQSEIWEIAKADGVNNCDLLLFYCAVNGAQSSVTVASCLSSSGPEGQLSQRWNGTGKHLEE